MPGVTNQKFSPSPPKAFFQGRLSNVLLDDLDKELERHGLPFVRYAGLLRSG